MISCIDECMTKIYFLEKNEQIFFLQTNLESVDLNAVFDRFEKAILGKKMRAQEKNCPE